VRLGVSAALDRLDSAWQEYLLAVGALDEATWPAAPPVNKAVLLIEPNDTAACFEYLPDMDRSGSIVSGNA
jgi:hypothetical protein